MMIVLAIVSVLAFAAIGLAASRLVGRTSPFLLGLGIAGSVLYLALLLHLPLAVSLGALGVTAAAILIMRPAPPREHVRYSWAATMTTLVPIAALLFITAITPLTDYDGRAFWLLKAKAIAHEQRIDGPFFQGDVMYDPRNEYPLLMSIDAAAVMFVSRDLDDQHVRWLYVLTLAALAFHARRWVGVWPAALLPWIPQFAFEVGGGAISAYSDIPLAAFLACAFFELIEAESPLRFGLWLAFMTLTKNEGLPIAAILLVPGAIRFRGRLGKAFVPWATAAGMLLAWRSRIPAGDEENFGAMLPTLPQRLARVPDAAIGFLRHAVEMNRWGVFWLVVVAAIALLLWRREWRICALPLYVLLAVGGLYVSVYAVSTWIMRDLINSSADRLLMHLVGPALFLLGAAQRAISEKQPPHRAVTM